HPPGVQRSSGASRLSTASGNRDTPARHGLTGRSGAVMLRRMSASRPRVAGVIVAGGRASRMGGRDKAFAAVGGQPIAVRTIRLFHELFPQVVVATQRPERFRGLDVETVTDRFPGGGPLAGIHTALLASRYPH